MTAQLSREHVEAIRDNAASEEIRILACMALAPMDSKPVATLDVQSGRPDGNKFALVYSSAAHRLPDDIYYLHAAPPAPVAVPDSFAVEKAVWDALNRASCPPAFMRIAAEACRAAMQAEPVTAATVPDGIKEALSEAVAAIYFTDSSDYLLALFAVVKAISPETLELLLSNAKAAYEATRINAAPAAPKQEV